MSRRHGLACIAVYTVPMNNLPINWNASYANKKDYLPSSTPVIELLVASVSENAPKKHLDIGCGTGQLVREIYHRGYETTGIDTSVEAIEIANRSSVFTGEALRFINTDVHSFVQNNPTDNSFGLVTCKYVIAFIEDVPEFLRHVAQGLHKEGTFYIISPDLAALSAEKISIAVDHQATMTLLEKHFAVTSQLLGRDWHYICRPAR